MKTKHYFIQTFGCQMNIHDSEKIAGMLKKLGYEETEDKKNADIIVFNTCCIRESAELKIMAKIGDIKALKKANKDLILVICGCMTQQKGMPENLKKKFPFINIIIGTHNLEELEEYVIKYNKTHKSFNDVWEKEKAIRENIPVYRTSKYNAWVNIMYGCNNFCSYCIVPYVRGRERSRNPELILEEINALLKAGYKEITLLGQNVDSYGSDRNDGVNFYTLLKKIAQIDTKFRLRFMTSHPKDLSEEVIKLIAETPNFCNNIHLPVQAGSNAVLKAMNRRYDRDRYFYLIDLIKKYMPDCGVTSDIMVGFPGETEEDFLDTLDLVKKVRYHNAFTFIYSPRKGTVAAKMEQIPYAIKSERIKRLIALQNQITLEISETYVGKIKEVLVEDAPKEGYLCGRTDCGRLVNFKGNKEMVGQFVNVKIEKNKASALIGEIVNEC